MAFLDNSGDIILDAVLTDTGRKRMAQGNFRITHFALGDDEIDYGLYNKNHPSGSAYFDLEILQTPVFEAFTQANANINHGLLTINSEEVLYLPTLAVNTKTANVPALLDNTGVFYVATNTETQGKIPTSTYTILESSATPGGMLVIESGLATGEIAGTADNRTSYLASLGLIDDSYSVYVDGRFVTSVLSSNADAQFNNDSQTPTANFGSLSSTVSTSQTLGLDNYLTYAAPTATNGVVRDTTSNTDTAMSDIAGPRGAVAAFNFGVESGLTTTAAGTSDDKFTQYGAVGQNLFSDGNLYDYIDTTVYVTGDNSSAQIQIPLRIIRYAGT